MRHSVRSLSFSAWLAAADFLALPVAGVGAEVRTMEVTGYCTCSRCCGPRACGVTFSGLPAKGLLAAGPRELPIGAIVRVPGYGGARVLDRGGAIRGDRLDLLFPTHQAALNWGRQKLDVQILRNRNASVRKRFDRGGRGRGHALSPVRPHQVRRASRAR